MLVRLFGFLAGVILLVLLVTLIICVNFGVCLMILRWSVCVVGFCYLLVGYRLRQVWMFELCWLCGFGVLFDLVACLLVCLGDCCLFVVLLTWVWFVDTDTIWLVFVACCLFVVLWCFVTVWLRIIVLVYTGCIGCFIINLITSWGVDCLF